MAGRHLILLTLLLLTAAPARAAYDDADALRRDGKFTEAKAEFEKVLAADPSSGGALEGLTLTCLRLGEYEEAASYAERWDRLSPGKPYIEGLLYQARRKRDAALRASARGVFPEIRRYRSIVSEGLDTASPQRIIYEGAYAGAAARVPLDPGLAVTAEAGVRTESQKNDTGKFTYYDLQETRGGLGLELGPFQGARFSGGYSYLQFTDLASGSVGRGHFHAGRAALEWLEQDSRLRVDWQTEPRFARGSGASTFFAILREHDTGAEAETSAGGVTLKGRYTRMAFSEGTGLDTGSVAASQEAGRQYAWLGWSRSFQEFYGADSTTGKLRFVGYQRVSGRWRYMVEDGFTAWAGGGYAWYHDTNRLWDGYVELQQPLPKVHELSARYRYEARDFRLGGLSYDSLDESSHAVGPEWKHGWGRAVYTLAGWEHAYVKDDVRGRYDADRYYATLEWHPRRDFSLEATGRLRRNTVKDDANRVELTARLTF